MEPTENILELYRQRAQQLRDQYDYIVLFYSGGADSQTVLESFVDNDIKLDEIATLSNYEATGNRDHFMVSEAFRVSYPKGQQIVDRYPWMKHTVIDISKMTLDYFLDPKAKYEWIYNLNMFFTAGQAGVTDLPYKIPAWANLINGGKRLCLLWGHDKPRIIHEDGKFVFKFLDLVDSGPKVNSMAGQTAYTDELFYWSPDLPKLLIKQGHLIKNYINANLNTSPFISERKSDLAFKMVNGKRYWLNNHGVHSVIYPKWDIGTFSAGKSTSIIFSERDDWFWGLEEPNDSNLVWRMGVEKLWQLLPDYWKNDPTSIKAGLKGCWSKSYYLE